MAVVTLQSQVCQGYAGNAAAVPVFHALGLDAWPVPSAIVSSNPHYPGWRDGGWHPSQTAALIDGLVASGAFDDADGVISGFLGAPAHGEALLARLHTLRVRGAVLPYCCDPVMGDADVGAVAGEALRGWFRDRALPAADVATPNHWELEQVTGHRCDRLDAIAEAARALAATGPTQVLVTGVATHDLPPGRIGVLLLTGEEVHVLHTPRLERSAVGAGDVLAAGFFGRLLRNETPLAAARTALAATHGLLVARERARRTELPLAGAAGLLAKPDESSVERER